MKKIILFVVLCAISITSAFCALAPAQQRPDQVPQQPLAQLAAGLQNSNCCRCLKESAIAACDATCFAMPCCCLGGMFSFGGSVTCAAVCFAAGTVFCVGACEVALKKQKQQRRAEANDRMHRD